VNLPADNPLGAVPNAENPWLKSVGDDVRSLKFFRTLFRNPTDSDLTLTGLPHAATVKICVSSVNAAGESQRSDAAQIVVP